MTAAELSRRLHHVRASYDNGVWRFEAFVFDKDGVFISSVAGTSGSFLAAATELTKRAAEAVAKDESEQTQPS